MARFQYYKAEEKPTPQQETQAATPAPPPNALQFFDDQTAPQQAWTGAIDVAMEAGSVAVDIASKLKEAEDQNKADEFFVDYTQQVSELRENINQKRVKSNRHDMDDLNGLTNYYKDEENKIYTDLSKKYNRENYKRRDSLMRDRKTTPFLSSMSSIRQAKIKEISRNNQERFKLFLEGHTQDLQEQSYELAIRNHDAQSYIKPTQDTAQGALERLDSWKNENKKIQEKIDNTIKNVIYPEAERRYQQGTILKSELDDLPNKVRTTVQKQVAFELVTRRPEVFLAIHNDEKQSKKSFGLIDSGTLARYWEKAFNKSIVIKDKREREQSDIDQAKYIYEFADLYESNDIDGLKGLIPKLKNEKDNWSGWTGKVRANALVTLMKGITTLENRELSADISRQGLGNEIESWKQSYMNLENDDLLQSPLAKYDFKSVYKDNAEFKQNTDRVKFLQKALPVFRKLKSSSNFRETKIEFNELKPQAKQWGSSLSMVNKEWNDLNQAMVSYDTMKRKNLPGVIRTERKQKQPEDFRSINNSADAQTALMEDAYDMEGMITDQLGYLGIKTNGKKYTQDPNLLLQVPGFKLLTPTDEYLFSKIITPNNAPEMMPAFKNLLKEKYGPLWSVALRDLKRAGVVDVMMEYGHALDSNGLRSHFESRNWQGNVGDFVSKNSNEYEKLLLTFNEKFGSAVETFPPRNEAFQGLLKYYAMVKSASKGDAPDIDDTVEQYFSGMVLIDAPFHLDSHYQNKIWESQEFLDSNKIDADTYQDGMISWMLTFRDSPDRIDDDLYVIGMEDLDPNYLTNLTPEQLEAYPKVIKLARDFRDQLMLTNIGSVNPADQPFISIVRNADGETYALALKHHPVGGIFRLGVKDENGNIQPITGSREEFVEHGTRYRRRKQAEMLANESGIFSGFFSNIPKGMTVQNWLIGARQNMKDSTAIEVLDKLESKISPNEMMMKGTDQPLKDAAKKLKKEIGETKEDEFWTMKSLGNFWTELWD